jgi:uncharacterized protein YybS (DUF2232 family)
MLGGDTLWHLQQLLQCIKYIIVYLLKIIIANNILKVLSFNIHTKGVINLQTTIITLQLLNLTFYLLSLVRLFYFRYSPFTHETPFLSA